MFRDAIRRAVAYGLAGVTVALTVAACGSSAQDAPNPLAGWRFYLPPHPDADAAARTQPAEAAMFAKLAQTPQAVWLKDGTAGQVGQRVGAVVAAARRRHQVPVLVAYDIPHRDCGGGQSTGGAPSPVAYRDWIRAVAAAIGTARAVVIVEPDALPQLDCLQPADQATRLSLLSDAVDTLRRGRSTVVYLDAGHAGWVPAPVMAPRLLRAGVRRARGFALNVSNFDWTSSELAYGDALSRATGGAHFIIDTSRNGRGPAPDNAWCNPPDRGLGARPTTSTGHRRADAFLWIKDPGFSDGACGPGQPPAGQWWSTYALGLAQRSSW